MAFSRSLPGEGERGWEGLVRPNGSREERRGILGTRSRVMMAACAVAGVMAAVALLASDEAIQVGAGRVDVKSLCCWEKSGFSVPLSVAATALLVVACTLASRLLFCHSLPYISLSSSTAGPCVRDNVSGGGRPHVPPHGGLQGLPELGKGHQSDQRTSASPSLSLLLTLSSSSRMRFQSDVFAPCPLFPA